MRLKFGAFVTSGSGKLGGSVIQGGKNGPVLRSQGLRSTAKELTASYPQYLVRTRQASLTKSWKALSQSLRDFYETTKPPHYSGFSWFCASTFYDFDSHWLSQGNIGGESRISVISYFGNGLMLLGTQSTGKIYRSTNYGQSWVNVSAPFGQTSVISFCDCGNGIILAGTGITAKILRSTDYGISWISIGSMFAERNIPSIISLGSGIVLASTTNLAHILRSSDNGLSWSDLGRQFSQLYIQRMLYLGSGIVIAGTGSSGYLLRSINYGLTWLNLGAQAGVTNLNTFCMLPSKAIIAGSTVSNVILKSSNLGLSFSIIGHLPSGVLCSDIIALSDNLLYCVTGPTQLLFKSIDGGITWLPVSLGFSADYGLSLCKLASVKLFLGTGFSGILASSTI